MPEYPDITVYLEALERRLPDRRRLLADRALSRLLKKGWPRTVDELEKPKRT